MFERIAITQSTGAMRLNSAPMMISTTRSGRSRKPDLAFGNGVLGARPRVAHHHRSGHHDCGQHDVEEPVDRGVVNQQADQHAEIGIAVEHGIEKAAEARHPIGLARHAAVHHVEQARADHDDARPAELARRQTETRPRY